MDDKIKCIQTFFKFIIFEVKTSNAGEMAKLTHYFIYFLPKYIQGVSEISAFLQRG